MDTGECGHVHATLQRWNSSRVTQPIVALLDARLAGVIETAAGCAFSWTQVRCIGEAGEALVQSGARVALLSPLIAATEPTAILKRFVTDSLGVAIIAVLGEDWANAHEALLRLGAAGVRHVVNLSEREGWNRLRALLLGCGAPEHLDCVRFRAGSPSSGNNPVPAYEVGYLTYNGLD